MTRRELMKLLGQGICTAASANTLLEAHPVAAEATSTRGGETRPGSAWGRTIPDVSPQDLAASSARAVLSRLMGARANEFDLAWTPPVNNRMVYEVTASAGRVSVKGSSGVAISRGAYSYLRETCNAMVTWGGQHLALPEKFPDHPRRRVVCPYQFTQYYNVCTFGYSTAFWDWERWQRELDWMALHGITMALAMVGHESIWQRVWESVGVTQTELDRFSTGPAYLPWHWMGNINKFDGPLPQSWIGQRRELQKLILRRMRALNITPVVPAFSGFVPKGLKRVCPEAKISTLLWSDQGSIPKETKTFMLHPDEAGLYKEIGRRFIQEYQQEFGPVEYYLADLFNEIEPPVSAAHRYEDLTRFAQNVYNGIIAGNANGKWVMQGWLFFADQKFWDNQSIQAFLSGIPDDRMIIIDYVGDLDEQASHPLWRKCDAFFGKQWMNGMIQNFGGNNNLTGNLALVANQPGKVLSSAEKGKLAGWAICPEGIETNEIVFELMTDAGWSEKEIDLHNWIPAYCRARYGAFPRGMEEAWDLLLRSAYGPDSNAWGSHFGWQRRPSLEPLTLHAVSAPLFSQAVHRFLSCGDQLSSNVLYRHDLIELGAQYVGYRVDKHLAAACHAHKIGQFGDRDRIAEESLDMLVRIDGLMNLRPDRRLRTWVDAARRFALSPDELAYYDSDARRLLTFWGWVELNDYAARVWAGLIRNYYAGRWRAFFQGLRENRPVSMDIWEQDWLTWPYSQGAARPVPDLAAETRQMLEICEEWHD